MIMLDCYASFINCFLGLGFYFTENTVCLITMTVNGKGLSEMYVGLHIKFLLFLYGFQQNQNVPTCHKIPNKNFTKFVRWESCSTCRQTSMMRLIRSCS